MTKISAWDCFKKICDEVVALINGIVRGCFLFHIRSLKLISRPLFLLLLLCMGCALFNFFLLPPLAEFHVPPFPNFVYVLLFT